MRSSVEDELIVQAIYLVGQMTLNVNHAKYIEIINNKMGVSS